jgi:predicted Zn-dependent peptidase
MNNIEKLKYDSINETVYNYRHSSGLMVSIVPKKGFNKMYAAIAVDYGSIDSHFIVPGESEITHVPDGVAHFLEHKLFEQKDGSVMDKFAVLGSSPNAFTSFNQTAYLFSCTENFDQNLNLLLDYVQNPYITEESVEKEKGIISQEIDMYEDNPGWKVYYNLLKSFYKSNSVKKEIAGTRESISKINREILYKCYNTFYHPSNMILTIAGDVNVEEIIESVERLIKTNKAVGKIERIYSIEPKELEREYIEAKMPVAMPITYFGFKENEMLATSNDYMKNEVMLKIAMELLIGRSSDLYNKLYNKGLINSEFSMDYSMERAYSYSIFGGETQNPQVLKEEILSHLDIVRRDGFKEDEFERIRRSMKGKHLKMLDSVDRIVRSLMSNYFKGYNAFDYFAVYDKIDLIQLNQIFLRHYKNDSFAMSVVQPMNGGL